MAKKGQISENSWIAISRNYWMQRIDECDMGCDWDEAHNRCWRCGQKGSLQKCHIIPASLGGKGSGENVIPLCRFCHDEAPDVADPTAMWSWIRRTHSPLYGRTMLLCDRAIRLAKELGVDAGLFDEQRFKAALKLTGTHFGQNNQGRYVKAETIAWAILEACKPDTSVPDAASPTPPPSPRSGPTKV